MATAGVAKENRQLVTDEFAAALGEDWRPVGQACALLLAPVGRGAPESEAVRQHAEDDRGDAVAGRLANQERG